jgi:hypothetical protein
MDRCAIYAMIFVGCPLLTTNARYFRPIQESLEALINCVVHRVGVVPGKPVAAITIYKCFLRWKSFEADKTGVFDRVIQMISSAFEVDATSSFLECTRNIIHLLENIFF